MGSNLYSWQIVWLTFKNKDLTPRMPKNLPSAGFIITAINERHNWGVKWWKKINVLNNEVRFYTVKEEDYISLTDIALQE